MSRSRAPVSKFVRAFAVSASVFEMDFKQPISASPKPPGLTRCERADDAGNETEPASERGDRGRAPRRVEETEIFRVAFGAEPREHGHVLSGAAFAEKEALVADPVQGEIVVWTEPVVRVFHHLRRVVGRGRAVVIRAPGDLLRNDLRVQRQDRASGPVDGNTARIETAAQAGDEFRHVAAAKPALDQPLDNAGRERRSVRSRKRLLHRDLRRKRSALQMLPGVVRHASPLMRADPHISPDGAVPVV